VALGGDGYDTLGTGLEDGGSVPSVFYSEKEIETEKGGGRYRGTKEQ